MEVINSLFYRITDEKVHWVQVKIRSACESAKQRRTKDHPTNKWRNSGILRKFQTNSYWLVKVTRELYCCTWCLHYRLLNNKSSLSYIWSQSYWTISISCLRYFRSLNDFYFYAQDTQIHSMPLRIFAALLTQLWHHSRAKIRISE